jgi:Flp pilus assembly protein TadD
LRAACVSLAVVLAGCAAPPPREQTVTDDTRMRLADVLEASGDSAGAAAALAPVGSRDGSQGTDALSHAELLILAGQPDKGVALAMDALVQRGDDVVFGLAVGRLALKAGQLAQAGDVYQQILRRHPDNLQALNGKSVVQAQQGDLAGAAGTLRQALAENPRDVTTRSNFALVMLLSGNNDIALYMLQDLAQSNPSPLIAANLALARKRLGVVQ